MMPALRVRVSNKPAIILHSRFPWSDCSTFPLSMMKLCSFNSSIHTDHGGDGGGPAAKEVRFDSNDSHVCYDDGYSREDKRRTPNVMGRQSPPDPIPNRPLRTAKPTYQSEQHLSRCGGGGNHGLNGRGYDRSTNAFDTASQRRKPVIGVGENRTTGRQSPRETSISSDLFPFDEFGNDDDKGGNTKQQQQQRHSPNPRPHPSRPLTGEEKFKQGHDFLDKFKLGYDGKGDNKHLLPDTANANTPLDHKQQQQQQEEMKAAAAAENLPPPQDADEIFKKMKETGLIPNAVAMLDGLCKDGLVQEAMKLFGLMREKGTIPEVVIYTAVVDGFFKAQKPEDAVRIFRKMQKNGISPNAFSYTVLIQGLYKSTRLEEALDFCVEMLEAGHSPNLATFAGLVNGFCREKGLEEARSTIGALRQKGFSFDEKLVREYLDKKGPFVPQVWEAIFGKKISQRSF